MRDSHLSEHIEYIDHTSDQRMDSSTGHESQKVSVVALADAISDPRAVMVMNLDASITVSAVERSRRFIHFTGPTLLHRYLLTAHNRMVL